MGGQNVEVDRGSAGALPKESDPPRVAPEVMHVGLQPAQSRRLILQPEVARDDRILRRQEP